MKLNYEALTTKCIPTALLVDLNLYIGLIHVYSTASEAASHYAPTSFPFPVMRRLFENISRARFASACK